MRRGIVGTGAVALATLLAVSISWSLIGALQPVSAQDGADRPAYYTEKVKPILATNCAQCHLGTAHRGGLSMATKAGMMKGGRDGAVIVPGDPASSLLVKLMRHEGPADDPMPMPPAPRPKASDADIATVTAWVKAGAVMPNDAPAQ